MVDQTARQIGQSSLARTNARPLMLQKPSRPEARPRSPPRAHSSSASKISWRSRGRTKLKGYYSAWDRTQGRKDKRDRIAEPVTTAVIVARLGARVARTLLDHGHERNNGDALTSRRLSPTGDGRTKRAKGALPTISQPRYPPSTGHQHCDGKEAPV